MKLLRHSGEAGFLLSFGITVSGVLALFVLMIGSLTAAESLPPPPITGTDCIDEKFKYLAEQDLSGVDLVAVGSSVTWRNIDVDQFETNGIGKKAINAAPCFLSLSQTAAFTNFLVANMPSVRTALIAVAPRDFEGCQAPVDVFFDEAPARRYLFENGAAFPIYASHFRPVPFLRAAQQVRELRSSPDVTFSLYLDPNGAGPLTRPQPWLPPFALEDACFDALGQLEDRLSDKGVRLIVASFPMSPAWRSGEDPSGEKMARFETKLRETLRKPSTTALTSRDFPAEEADYVDAVHFKWPVAVRYSASLAEQLRRIERPILPSTDERSRSFY